MSPQLVRPLGDWSGVLAATVLVMGLGVFLQVATPYVVAFASTSGRSLYLAANGLLILGSVGLLLLLVSHAIHEAGRND